MSKRKLLLADDSVTIQKVVNLTFADEGIEVISVGDGDSAMEKVAEISPDLIMADVNMPGLNGYQICEQIRQDEQLRHTPVILLVGSFEPFDEEEAKRVGADDFLTKPFQSIRQLVNKVTILLNSTDVGSENYQTAHASSFADTLELENPPIAAPVEPTSQYSDSSFDDEMIQTNQVSTYALDDSYKFETKDEVHSEDDFSKTQSLTADEIKEFGLKETTWEIAEESYKENEVSPEEETVYSIPADEETKEFAYTVNDENAYSETEETFSETSLEDNPIVEDKIEEADEVSYVANDLSETSEAEDIPAAVERTDSESENMATEAQEDMPLPEVATVLESDEDDLLELPPIESDFEEETSEEAISETVESEEVAETEEVIPAVQTQTADSLSISPELIEAIANRVVEKLSEKAVKEVAWEVVPQMTELIVKKLAEEKLKD